MSETETEPKPRPAENALDEKDQTRRRTRTSRPFPAGPFEDSLNFAREMYTIGSGRPVRRLTLFDHLGKAPESGPIRAMITNASRYGLIRGSYSAEQLELTADGLKAIGDNVPAREQPERGLSWQ